MGQFTVAIAGLGARGLNTYAPFAKLYPEKMRITAVADVMPERVERARREYGLPASMCFDSAEKLLSQPKLADVMIIATQDRQHYDMTMRAMRLGYDILLEKPISPDLGECLRLRDAAGALGRKVMVCHVLRYTKFYEVLKQIIDGGSLGKIVNIFAVENVGYWHMAHSFVRGNWRSSLLTSPMILQKCCHDFDIFTWLTGKNCISVSSMGGLSYFKPENAPLGSAAYCSAAGACRKECPYDAYKIYMEHPHIGYYGAKNRGWPVSVLEADPTPETLGAALDASPYGRCVFRCDNDVVDHQIVNMLYEDGVAVSFTMTGFTNDNSRGINIMLEKGEVSGCTNTQIIEVQPFGGEKRTIDIAELTDDLSGHGGGDNEMLRQLFERMDSSPSAEDRSSIEKSVHSHIIAFAAETSRLAGGGLINIEEFEREFKK